MKTELLDEPRLGLGHCPTNLDLPEHLPDEPTSWYKFSYNTYNLLASVITELQNQRQDALGTQSRPGYIWVSNLTYLNLSRARQSH